MGMGNIRKQIYEEGFWIKTLGKRNGVTWYQVKYIYDSMFSFSSSSLPTLLMRIREIKAHYPWLVSIGDDNVYK